MKLGSPEQVHATVLRQILMHHFDDSELRTLCFDLNIDYDSLPGQGKGEKARELVAYARRHGRTDELIAKCCDLRPNADWQKVPQNIPPEQLPRKKEIQETVNLARNRVYKSLKFWFVIGSFVVLVTIVIYLLFFQYSGFASDFIPLRMTVGQVNAKVDYYVAAGANVSTPLTWYERRSNGLNSPSEIPINYLNINRYLYYGSKLSTQDYTWTGIFFWKSPFPALNVSDTSEFVTIIYAENPDVLEIGFADVHGNEKKINLQVVKGWAGYRIPLSEFSSLDFNKIRLFLIAHTKALATSNENSFKLALLSFR